MFFENKILTFNEVGELATIDDFSNSDLHAKARVNGKKYKVKTISLEDLLDKYNAPKIIDYLSIDTEGSELDILSSFNFEKSADNNDGDIILFMLPLFFYN